MKNESKATTPFSHSIPVAGILPLCTAWSAMWPQVLALETSDKQFQAFEWNCDCGTMIATYHAVVSSSTMLPNAELTHCIPSGPSQLSSQPTRRKHVKNNPFGWSQRWKVQFHLWQERISRSFSNFLLGTGIRPPGHHTTRSSRWQQTSQKSLILGNLHHPTDRIPSYEYARPHRGFQGSTASSIATSQRHK